MSIMRLIRRMPCHKVGFLSEKKLGSTRKTSGAYVFSIVLMSMETEQEVKKATALFGVDQTEAFREQEGKHGYRQSPV